VLTSEIHQALMLIASCRIKLWSDFYAGLVETHVFRTRGEHDRIPVDESTIISYAGPIAQKKYSRTKPSVRRLEMQAVRKLDLELLRRAETSTSGGKSMRNGRRPTKQRSNG
jgi:hypothetical protein